MQEALNQVHMREHHAAAAVPVQLQLGKCLAFGTAFNEKRKVRVPFVAHDLAATEAAHRDDLRQNRNVPSAAVRREKNWWGFTLNPRATSSPVR